MGYHQILKTATSSLNEKQAKTIFSEYDLGEVSGFKPASQGKETTNYYISTGTREYVLTLLEKNGQLNPVLKPLLASCTEAGLPVPRLFPNRAGAFQGSFKNRPVFVRSRMQGRHVFDPTIAQCASTGRFMARFHNANSSRMVESQPVNTDFLDQQANRVYGYMPPADARLLEDSIGSIRSMLRRTDVQNLPRGVIHGALFRSNVLFNERGLSGAPDFHQAGYGYWVFDLAIAVNDWCINSRGESNHNKTLALITAYDQIRSLTREEFWYLPLFMSFAAVSIWLKHLVRNPVGNPNGGAGTGLKNSRQFREIVALHASRPFHLDERLLQRS